MASSTKGVDNNAAGNDIQSTFAPITPDATLLDVMKNGAVGTMDEFYVVFGKGITETQRITPSEAVDFSFDLYPYAKGMAVVYSTVQNGTVTYLLYEAYAKLEDGTWAFYELRHDECAYERMDAAALSDRAHVFEDNKEYLPTAVYAYLSGNVLSPCGIVYTDSEMIQADIAAM